MATPLLKRITPLSPKPIYPHSISNFSTFPSPPLDQTDDPLIPTVTSLLTHHRSKSRWTYLRSLILSSSSKTLNPAHFSRITLNLKSNPHLAFNFFNFTLKNQSFCSHNLHSLSTIIHVLSRARLKSRAQEIMSYALKSQSLCSSPFELFEILLKTYRHCDSAPVVFDLLTKSCLELRKIDEILKIVRKLRSSGFCVPVSTCNSLVSLVCKHKGSCVGYGVFGEVFGGNVRPNVHSFNELMMSFYRDGDLDMVMEVWKEMERFECVSNAFSYSVLMAAFVEDGKVEDAERLWTEMREQGIKGDVVLYNTIMGGFCKAGKIEKAEEIFRDMEFNGVECSCITFEHLITCYCKVGDVDSAILVFKDMIRREFRAEGVIIDVLVKGLCEKKRVLEGLEIMRIATRNCSVGTGGKSYEMLIRGLCEDGRMDEALKLQAEMVGKGYEPNSEVYGAFIDGYTSHGNEAMAANLRKELAVVRKQPEES